MRLQEMNPGVKQSTWSAIYQDSSGKWVEYLHRGKYRYFFEDNVQEVCDSLNQTNCNYRMFRHDTTRVL